MTSADNNMTGAPRWSVEDKQRIRDFWNNGETASQIAARIGNGTTRSAILGVLHRMGAKTGKRMPITVTKDQSLSGQGKSRGISAGILRRTEIRLDSPDFNSASPMLKGSAWQPLPGSSPVPLMDHNGCKWIVGPDNLWCNEPKQGGSSWCPAHHARAFQKRVTA